MLEHIPIFSLYRFLSVFLNPCKVMIFSYFFVNYVSITNMCYKYYPISVHIIMDIPVPFVQVEHPLFEIFNNKSVSDMIFLQTLEYCICMVRYLCGKAHM